MRRDPLFAGLTRPTTLMGIPSDAFGFMVMTIAIGFMATRNFLVLLLFPVAYAIIKLLCAKDPRFFRYLVLWIQTKGRGMNRALWGNSSYAPTRYRKR